MHTHDNKYLQEERDASFAEIPSCLIHEDWLLSPAKDKCRLSTAINCLISRHALSLLAFGSIEVDAKLQHPSVEMKISRI